MLDHVTHLFRFRTIVEAGSVSRAAEELHVSQPALSRSLSVLENHYGRPLLERHAKGVTPTAFGARVLQVSHRVSRLWEVCEEQLGPGDAGELLTLRIGAGPAWRRRILPDVLLATQQTYPRLVLEIHDLVYETALADIHEGRADILFMGGFDRFDLSDLTVHPLITVKDWLAARKGHPIFADLSCNGTVPQHFVMRYPWLEMITAQVFGTQIQDALFGALGVRPKPMITCSSLDSALAILQRSDYIAILPDAVLDDPGAPNIVPVPLDIHTNYGLAGMVCRPEMSDWPQVMALLQGCQEWLSLHRSESSLASAS